MFTEKAYKPDMRIFELSRTFPLEEKFALRVRFVDHRVRYV